MQNRYEPCRLRQTCPDPDGSAPQMNALAASSVHAEENLSDMSDMSDTSPAEENPEPQPQRLTRSLSPKGVTLAGEEPSASRPHHQTGRPQRLHQPPGKIGSQIHPGLRIPSLSSPFFHPQCFPFEYPPKGNWQSKADVQKGQVQGILRRPLRILILKGV